VDPLTLLAAANAAIAAAKAGCKLYRDIKGTAGEVKEVLDDLKKQFNSKPRNAAEKIQYNEEVQRVQIIAKTDPNDAISQVGEHLGKFFDAMDAVEKIFWDEENNASKVYDGDVSLSRRALQRVLIRTRLDQMLEEIREEMVYRSPPEMKDVYTRFEAMRARIVGEQQAANEERHREQQIAAWNRRQMIEEFKEQAVWGGAVLFVVVWMVLVFVFLRTTETYRGLY
jgi:hypothetical protein